jgi:hypothetical protein
MSPAADQCETELHTFVQPFFTHSPMDAHRFPAERIAETAAGSHSEMWASKRLWGRMLTCKG